MVDCPSKEWMMVMIGFQFLIPALRDTCCCPQHQSTVLKRAIHKTKGMQLVFPFKRNSLWNIFLLIHQLDGTVKKWQYLVRFLLFHHQCPILVNGQYIGYVIGDAVFQIFLQTKLAKPMPMGGEPCKTVHIVLVVDVHLFRHQ